MNDLNSEVMKPIEILTGGKPTVFKLEKWEKKFILGDSKGNINMYVIDDLMNGYHYPRDYYQ